MKILTILHTAFQPMYKIFKIITSEIPLLSGSTLSNDLISVCSSLLSSFCMLETVLQFLHYFVSFSKTYFSYMAHMTEGWSAFAVHLMPFNNSTRSPSSNMKETKHFSPTISYLFVIIQKVFFRGPPFSLCRWSWWFCITLNFGNVPMSGISLWHLEM